MATCSNILAWKIPWKEEPGGPKSWTQPSTQNIQPQNKQTNKKTTGGGLPWWCSGQESACQFRGHRFHPWTVMILHATEQLSSCATTTEPVLHNKRSHLNEKPKHHSEESPSHHNWRKPTCKATKTQNCPPKKPQNWWLKVFISLTRKPEGRGVRIGLAIQPSLWWPRLFPC